MTQASSWSCYVVSVTIRPIVIVGAGPAGLITALSLARHAPAMADRTIVLERARFPRDKICAGALGERGWRVLRQLDAAPDVPGVAVHGFRVISSEPTCQQRHPRPIGRVIRRLEFDAALAERAQDLGVRLQQATRVEKLDEHADHVRVVTSQGVVEASVVVGAGGVGSIVRRSMAQPAGGLRAQVVEVDTPHVDGDPPQDLLCFDVSDHSFAGYSWHFPTRIDGRTSMCRGVYQLRPGPGAEPWLKGRAPVKLASKLSELLTARGLDPSHYAPKRFSERGFTPGSRLAEGRRILVGEAAGIDPLSGEGLAQGIEYGELAGRFLASHPHEPAALAAWQRTVTRSRLGWDLRLCHRLLPRFYGSQRRRTEALIFSHEHILSSCLERFTGRLPGAGLAVSATWAVGRAWWRTRE